MRFVIFLLSMVVAAKADPLAALAADAPFRHLNEATAAPANDWVLKGAVRLGDRHLLSLFDPVTATARWIAEGEERAGLKVIGYDPAAKVAKVQRSGRIERLRLAPVETRPK